ncbi:acylase [Fulvivirgaceae bacterium BMA10]|uniref:Acylase n=1 Tax=Splendidivirga corallicola TaxID=3051826 RepID=A0ABT8KP65_9BACT|nr:acylase [Fulvivirgaceae bacterium BMA10]
MRKLFYLFLVIFTACSSPGTEDQNTSSLEQRAKGITIIRDNWGVPHIYGKTDAHAVFGLMYAQCEDDFNRVEMNYINAMGRLAEVEGEAEIYRDLRMKLFIDPEEMKQAYEESPDWLKELMNAFADGINYYLENHPEVKPKLLTHFEPWMALTFSEGSIGGDIERVSIRDLETFYGGKVSEEMAADALIEVDDEPRGSNGFAIAPSNSASGNALFLINPHTSFFFRSEVHMISEEGLNAYGAVTWGQFFVYQGFNEHCGWMHTSSRADAIDEYLETIIEKDGAYYYKHGNEEKELKTTDLTLPYKTDTGMEEKTFTVYHSHHGPVIREEDGKWVSISLMQEPVKAITQSYLRTKAKGHEDFYKTMEIRTNSSNNTVYADAEGNIAYYHGNFIPKRNTQFDWTQPLDGSDPATDWQGLHTVEEMITVLNPENGWIQNCNSTPFTAAGSYSPNPEDYPSYMAPDRENFRGIHAIRVLENKKDFTIEKLIEAAYDPYLTGFEVLIPSLLEAYDQKIKSNGDLQQLSEPMEMLRNWDLRYTEESIPTSLAVYWGQEMLRVARNAQDRGAGSIYDYIAKGTSFDTRIEAFAKAIQRLESDFGTWKTAWGEINRFQRITGDIVQPFDDDQPSLPVAFASGRWGSLASFGARTYPNTKKMYGTSGNSFVAVVEFGEKLRAVSIVTGGQSGDPQSPHFNDQSLMYTKGKFKDVLFYRDDVEKNSERTYNPGD